MVVYATREQVVSSLEIMATSRSNKLIDQKLAATAPGIESLTHRRFYPELKTVKFDWPNYQYAQAWRLYLDDNELISITSLTTGGVTLSTNQYFLRRSDNRDEPPYNIVDIDLSQGGAFSAGPTFQRAISIVGLYGYDNNTKQAATLSSGITNSQSTMVVAPVNNIQDVGVGSLLTIGTEKIITTQSTMVTSSQTLGADIASSQAVSTVSVQNGSTFGIDEIILIDAERMRIVDIAGNNLIVKRAWDGTVLSAHTNGATIYANRQFNITRGVLGTTAASHNSSDSILTQIYASGINELQMAEAVVAMEQNSAAYARVVGSGANQRESAGQGLEDLRYTVETTYARKSRIRGV